MRPALAICLLLALFETPTGSPAQTAGSFSPLTLAQYRKRLDDTINAIQRIKGEPEIAAELVKTLPSAWHVEADGRTFDISNESIRRELGAWQSKSPDAIFDRISQHLETLRYEAAAYENAAPDLASQRSRLDSILSRSEFRNVQGQNWIDRLKQRITDFLLRALGKVFSSSAIPMISDILVYGLIVGAVIAVAYWMYRSLRDSTRLETIMPVNIPVSGKDWPVWLFEARTKAAMGEWRDAVHLAYWGGISFLEAQGSWRPDRARTPREYLRLLPATSSHQPALRALTMRLEGVWYGMQVAGPDSFEQTLAELERLGCPCN